MTHFILLISIVTGHGVAVDHVEYDSKQACEVASAMFWQHSDQYARKQSLVLVCSPKT